MSVKTTAGTLELTDAAPLGAHHDGSGASFALFSWGDASALAITMGSAATPVPPSTRRLRSRWSDARWCCYTARCQTPGDESGLMSRSMHCSEPAFGLEPKTFSLQVKCSTS
jgi:hypothetical protein